MATNSIDLEEKVDRLTLEIQELTRTHNQILELLEAIQEEVGPVVVSLSNSPLLKMLGGK